MTQKDKELLLKDICARLPYRVKGNFLNDDGTLSNDKLLKKITIIYQHLVTASGRDGMVLDGSLKPYLLPLSSMNEEQKQYLKNKHCYDWDGEPYDLWKCQIEIGDADELIDWFNKNHFDYRGLIEKGLAIDATGKNIY